MTPPSVWRTLLLFLLAIASQNRCAATSQTLNCNDILEQGQPIVSQLKYACVATLAYQPLDIQYTSFDANGNVIYNGSLASVGLLEGACTQTVDNVDHVVIDPSTASLPASQCCTNQFIVLLSDAPVDMIVFVSENQAVSVDYSSTRTFVDVGNNVALQFTCIYPSDVAYLLVSLGAQIDDTSEKLSCAGMPKYLTLGATTITIQVFDMQRVDILFSLKVDMAYLSESDTATFLVATDAETTADYCGAYMHFGFVDPAPTYVNGMVDLAGSTLTLAANGRDARSWCDAVAAGVVYDATTDGLQVSYEWTDRAIQVPENNSVMLTISRVESLAITSSTAVLSIYSCANPITALDIGLMILAGMGVVAAVVTAVYCACFRKRKTELIVVGRANRSESTMSDRDAFEISRESIFIDYGHKLGKGAFGDVYRGSFIDPSSKDDKDGPAQFQHFLKDTQYVAIKMLHDCIDYAGRAEFLREIALMKSIGAHDRLVNIICCVTRDEPLLLVIEYCACGDLLSFLRKRKSEAALSQHTLNPDPNDDAFSFTDQIMFSVQIATGMEFLVSRGYIHRDLAARNVLVDSRRTCKIGDFGLCRRIDDEDETYLAKGGKMPYKWMPPEAFRTFLFSSASDVWSFGVVLFEIFTLGEVPYADWPAAEVLDRLDAGERLQRPINVDEHIFHIMKRCWAAEPNDRPDFGDLKSELSKILEMTDESSNFYMFLT